MSTFAQQIRQDYIRSKEREAIDRRYGKILAEEQRKFIKEERMRRQHAIHLMDSNSKLNRQIETLEHMNADIDQYNIEPGSCKICDNTLCLRLPYWCCNSCYHFRHRKPFTIICRNNYRNSHGMPGTKWRILFCWNNNECNKLYLGVYGHGSNNQQWNNQ